MRKWKATGAAKRHNMIANPRVCPYPDFCVAVGKRKPGSAVMIGGWQINPIGIASTPSAELQTKT